MQSVDRGWLVAGAISFHESPTYSNRPLGMFKNNGRNMQMPSAKMSDSSLVYVPVNRRGSPGWLHPSRFGVASRLRGCWVDEPKPAYGHLMQRLGKALRSRREAAGYSQESFADRIGMHRAYYSAIERGEKNLQLDTLQRVCDGLSAHMWEVLKDAEA